MQVCEDHDGVAHVVVVAHDLDVGESRPIDSRRRIACRSREVCESDVAAILVLAAEDAGGLDGWLDGLLVGFDD